MEMEKEKVLQTLQMRFIAKILSTYTHEMKNHLAIIKESSGLIQDMIEMGKLPKKKKDAGLFVSTLQAIDGQVERSSVVIRILNRFGHRMDKPAAAFDVNEVIEELIVLMHRLARQKQILLESHFQEKIPKIHCSPYRVQLILFSLIQEKLENLDPPGKVVLSTSVSDKSVKVMVREEGNRRSGGGQVEVMPTALMDYALQEFHGEIGHEAAGHRITVRIPLTEA